MIRAMYRLERRCYSAARKINVLTEAFRDNIVARGLAEPSKICYVPNGVDTEQQRPELWSERLREELGWSGRDVTLYSGAHGVANRVEQLLQAAELLRDRPEILIATVGSGMELEPLRSAAREQGLTELRPARIQISRADAGHHGVRRRLRRGPAAQRYLQDGLPQQGFRLYGLWAADCSGDRRGRARSG